MQFPKSSKLRPGKNQPFRMALVAMPWAIFNRPSIQLGALKAFLNREADWLTIDTFHPYLEVARELGTEFYHHLSQDAWLGEALYSSVLFPEHRKSSNTLIKKRIRANAQLRRHFPADPDQVSGILAKQLATWADRYDWGQYRLVGFSVCFNQLLASLAAAAALKKRHPHLITVFGGSSCSATMSDSLLNLPQVDHVIHGEGEIPLLQLCEFLAGRREKPPTEERQLKNLAELPVPDYRDYFKELDRIFADEPFIPTLPLEFSRGCWWGKCAFCNLNLQWRGYRWKKAAQVLAEATGLAQQYATLDFTFTDNALPPKEAGIFFKEVAKKKLDLQFFGEIRVTDSRKMFAAYQQGGLTTVQAGIESLSNSLLKRLRKGVSVIDNIEAMKTALEQGITLKGNLIIEFPGSTAAEVEETLTNLDFVLPFTPLDIAAFFLGQGSPVDFSPAEYGIRAITHHRHNRDIFPKPLLNGLSLMVKDYRGDRALQKKLWQPVVDKITIWQNFHKNRRENTLAKPPLSFRDGGDFLIIRQEAPGQPTRHHRLRGQSRKIYLFCARPRSTKALERHFQAINKDNLRAFLLDLKKKRLLFHDNDQYLALAIPDKR